MLLVMTMPLVASLVANAFGDGIANWQLLLLGRAWLMKV
jgi:hypothetical protein